MNDNGEEDVKVSRIVKAKVSRLIENYLSLDSGVQPHIVWNRHALPPEVQRGLQRLADAWREGGDQ